jgi:cobalt-zinc-cadmium efflux system membrane fusion protein
MKNKPHLGIPSGQRPVAFARMNVAVVMVLAPLLLFSACSRQAGGEPRPAAATASNVTLTDAQRRNIRLYAIAPSKFRNTVETTGVVDFDNNQATRVLAPFSGPVSRLLVSPGEQVKQGDPLAVVQSPDFALAVSSYRKARASAQTARRLADLDKDLLEHQGISRREAEQAETDATNAESDRDAALQALVSLNVDPQAIKEIAEGRPVTHLEGLVRAPITGTVVERLITAGQLLQAGTTPCFTVANLSRVWVMAQLFGSDLALVKVGDLAEVVTGTTSASVTGRVDNISALVNPDTRAVTVRVVVDNPGDVLKKQMYVRVLIRARQESSGILVPVAAVLRDDTNLPFVYVVQRDGSFARQPVTLGHRVEEQYEIPAGLKAGDQIVADGAIFVQFMQNQ